MDYQRIFLLGETTSQAEVKQSKTGTYYAQFDMVFRRGENQTIFFPVTVVGEFARTAAQVLPKGTRVLVEGFLDIDRNSGKFRVVADAFCKVQE